MKDPITAPFKTPPRLACWLLRLRLSKAHYECIAGDLFEEYSTGGHPASWFWQQTLSVITPKFEHQKHSASQGTNPMNLFSGFAKDIQYAVRTLRLNVGFTAVAVLALGFGIGVNTTVFTFLNAVALRPLPVRDASSIVSIYQTFRGPTNRSVDGAISYFSYPEFQTYRDQNKTLSGIAASALVYVSLGGTTPRSLAGQIVTCNYFTVLGRTPALGREFTKEECETPNEAPVAVLGHDFWSSQFHADPSLIGKTIVINRRALTVIGVAPKGFPGTSLVPAAFWAPITMQPTMIPGRKNLEKSNLSWLEMVGRLEPGVSISQARADLSVIADRIDQTYVPRKTVLAVDVATLLGDPESRTILFAGGSAALLAVGLVLMIACANIANLMLARAAARQKEIAIRLATGASRWRLVRMLLTESVLIAVMGGAAGVVMANWSSQFLLQFVVASLPSDLPGVALNIELDLRILGYAFLISLLTSAAFGLAPAFQATRVDLNSALKDEGSGLTTGASRSWLRAALVSVQVSVCLVLLVAAGLLMRGLQAAQSVDPGFKTTNTLTAELDLKRQGYTDARAAVFNRQLVEIVSGFPGIDAVSLAGLIPLSGSNRETVVEMGTPPVKRHIRINSVSHQYFALMGIPIVRGRGFTEAETRERTLEDIAVISEATARRFWPGEDPVGKQMRHEDTLIEVIGVARDARSTSLSAVDSTYVYFPVTETGQSTLSLLIHSSEPPVAVARRVRSAVGSLDSAVIVNAKTIQEYVDFWKKPSLLVAAVAATLGFVGLLLASVGIYGVISYGVNRRIREMGIRITLGADTREILTLVVGQGMRPVLAGLGVGLLASAGVAKLMSFALYGVNPIDPLTFIGVSACLTAVALLACYLPARRATRVDPMVALRYE